MHIKTSIIDIKRINKNKVYRYILNNREVSNNSIAIALKMSLPTIIQNTKELLEEGLIRDDDFFESTGGRKAKVLSPQLNVKLSIGLEITKNHIALALINLGGDVISHSRIGKKFANDEKYCISIGQVLDDFIKSCDIDIDSILGVGVSIAGIVDSQKSLLLNSYALGGLKNLQLDELTKYIKYPKYYTNDANAAAVAELWASKKRDSFVYLFLGNSVGGAIINDGKVLPGKNYSAGEFGHVGIVHNGKTCSCKKKGCLEPYCSAVSLEQQSGKKLADYFAALDSHDPKCERIWQEYAMYLQRAIDIIYMSFNCDIVLGGYVGRLLNQSQISNLARAAAKNNIFGEESDTFVRGCKTNEEASAMGAASYFIDKFIKNV